MLQLNKVQMRKPVNSKEADGLLHWIWDELPPFAKPFMEATFSGHDPEAARHLVSAAPNEWRGQIALCAYWIGLPNPAYREIMDSVWIHDHWQLRSAVARGGLPQIRRMMASAEFPVPLMGDVTIYRGAADVAPPVAVKGLSWTTSREVACWFAFHWISRTDANRFVLTATVRASDMIYWSNNRDEHEVLLRKPPSLRIDDNPGEWNELADRFAKRRRSSIEKMIGQRSVRSVVPTSQQWAWPCDVGRPGQEPLPGSRIMAK